MEVLTLVQTGKADPMPIVFIDTPGGDYWKDWERYVRKHLLKRGKIAEEDFNLFMVTDSVNKAADEIAGFIKITIRFATFGTEWSFVFNGPSPSPGWIGWKASLKTFC
jgi:predicted Rossmann-fold nucleotide-binding protein